MSPHEREEEMAATPDPWRLETDRQSDEPLYLANGYLGIAVAPDGGALIDSNQNPCFVRGVYSPTGPEGIDRYAVAPSWSQLRYGAPAQIHRYARRLDLVHGELCTYLTLEEQRGLVHLEQQVFVSRADRHRAAVRLRIVPTFNGEITVESRLEAQDGGGLTIIDSGMEESSLWMRGTVAEYGIEVAERLVTQRDNWNIVDESATTGRNARMLCATACAGRAVEIAQIATVATSLESGDPWREVNRPVPEYGFLERHHRDAWSDLWNTDIQIEGDPEVQQFVHAGLFYLWSSMWARDRWSIAPMGLSGNGYNGHIFWDAELWMYPSLLVTHPDLASGCVSYRRQTLPKAKERAREGGHCGAQFPWESGFTGDEMTPRWAATRDYQLHVTADVAIGQWWHFLNTGDKDWLRGEGFEVIRECAEFWRSRVEYDQESNRYEISDVVCADEYAEHVNNNAFTNAAVKAALRIAVRAAEILGEPADPEWSIVADKLVIPYDRDRGVHIEYDGYDGRTTKQADVELLSYPLEHVHDNGQVARDLDFYRNVIDSNGPAMSYSVYSILSAQLGRQDEAYDFLRQSFVPNTRRPFWTFSETPSNDEFFFCTGVGGALQGLLFGFTGLRLREGYFSLKPLLPRQWKALRLTGLFVLGARTDIEMAPDELMIRRKHQTGTAKLVVSDDDRRGAVIRSIQGPDGMVVEVSRSEGLNPDFAIVPAVTPVDLPELRAGVRIRLRSDEKLWLDVELSRLP